MVVGLGRRRRVVSTGSVSTEPGGAAGAVVAGGATVVSGGTTAVGGSVLVATAEVSTTATTVVPVSTFVLLSSSSPLTALTEKPTTRPSATPPAIELVSHLRG